jgi:hypothetical protein
VNTERTCGENGGITNRTAETEIDIAIITKKKKKKKGSERAVTYPGHSKALVKSSKRKSGPTLKMTTWLILMD